MSWRLRVRRLIPYLVTALAGFTIAFLVLFLFVFRPSVIPDNERRAWAWQTRTFEAQARAGYGVRDALALVRSPQFQWPRDLYPRVCAPAPRSRAVPA